MEMTKYLGKELNPVVWEVVESRLENMEYLLRKYPLYSQFQVKEPSRNHNIVWLG